jgi:cytochrome P450
MVAAPLVYHPAIPRAPGPALLGNARELLLEPLEFFLKSYQTLGPAFSAGGMGRRYIVLAGPEANRFLAHGAEQYLDNRPIYRHIAEELGSAHYPIATDGARHAHLRRTIKGAFTHAALERYVPQMVAAARRDVQSWQPGRVMPALAMMHRLTGDQIGQALLSAPLGISSRRGVTFARFSIGPGLGAYPMALQHYPPYWRAKTAMLASLRRMLAAHRAAPPNADRAPDFLDLLLAATDEIGQPYSEADIIANAQMAYSNSMIYGGPVCAFLLYAALKFPDVRARIQPEIDAFFATETPTFAGVMQLRVLRAAMLESLRRYPVALATPRVVAEPFAFQSYHVPAGHAVFFAGSVCHLLPEIFPDPRRFDPDRFLEPRNEQRQSAMFVPFGLASHSCLGAGLVELLAMLTVATILHHWDLTLAPADYELRRVVNPFPEPGRRFRVKVQARRA